ncbi:hypothetical protein BH743_12275 [Enterococcus faecium]|nr:hypothetical protein BH743_12275 [Enterococcus faecium]OTO22005.1 ImpB/MucB/SamB family protein [Enterococcus sp. 3G1_DIV0629]
MLDYSDEPVNDYFLIGMKSFYASFECIERNLEPLTIVLVIMSWIILDQVLLWQFQQLPKANMESRMLAGQVTYLKDIILLGSTFPLYLYKISYIDKVIFINPFLIL